MLLKGQAQGALMSFGRSPSSRISNFHSSRINLLTKSCSRYCGLTVRSSRRSKRRVKMQTDVFGLITWQSVLFGVLLFLVTFAISLAIVSFIMVKIPAEYFRKDTPRDLWSDKPPVVRFLGVFVKNLLGLLLVALGIVMSIPGVPGQGILTILLGIMLLDFPGKRDLEYRLVSRPRVFNTINKLRHRFGKDSLVLD